MMEEEGSSMVLCEDMGSSSGSNDAVVGARYDASSPISGPKQSATHILAQHESCAAINSDNHTKNLTAQVKAAKRPSKPLSCPRCNSLDTKFCYFNNYNVNQPRHYCKGCQRYWTAGGVLRNVPVGAGFRRQKHISVVQPKQSIAAVGSAGKPTLKPAFHGEQDTTAGVLNNQVYVPLSLPIEGGSVEPMYMNHDIAIDANVAQPSVRMPETGLERLIDAAPLPGNFMPKVDGARLPDFKPIVCGNNVRQSGFTLKVPSSGNGHPRNESACGSCITSQPLGAELCGDPKLQSKPKLLEEGPSDVPNCGMSMHYGSNMCSLSTSPCINMPQCNSQASLIRPLSVLPPSNSLAWLGVPPGTWTEPLSLPAMGAGASTTVDEPPYMSGGQKHKLDLGDGPDGCLWVPKTLRIDDPVEAARSSIWSTLGLGDRPNNLVLNDACTSSSGNTTMLSEQPTLPQMPQPNLAKDKNT